MSDMDDRSDLVWLTNDQMVRLLRAKAGELENMVLSRHRVGPFEALQADIALIAHILAAHIERTNAAAG